MLIQIPINENSPLAVLPLFPLPVDAMWCGTYAHTTFKVIPPVLNVPLILPWLFLLAHTRHSLQILAKIIPTPIPLMIRSAMQKFTTLAVNSRLILFPSSLL